MVVRTLWVTDRSLYSGFESFNNSTSEGVLDLLEASYLRLGQVVIERITVVKFGMNDRVGDGRSCFVIEVRADASELMDMITVVVTFGYRGNLVSIG